MGIRAITGSRPAATYRSDNFTATDVPITGFEAAPERGDVVVRAGMKGKLLSGGLVYSATAAQRLRALVDSRRQLAAGRTYSRTLGVRFAAPTSDAHSCLTQSGPRR